jgi:hypothetical protein
MKIYYHGPKLTFGQVQGLWGDLRGVSLQGLWQRVQQAKVLGDRLAHAEVPVMGYLQSGKRERLDCLLCGHRLRAKDHWLDMVVLVIPHELADESAVLVSALCHPCCAAEPDDTRLLVTVEAVLQKQLILGPEQPGA